MLLISWFLGSVFGVFLYFKSPATTLASWMTLLVAFRFLLLFYCTQFMAIGLKSEANATGRSQPLQLFFICICWFLLCAQLMAGENLRFFF
jgi:hypothetical protein